MSNNPFDWRNYTPVISLKDIARAQKSAWQQSRVVNRQRAAGIEPTAIHLPGSQDVAPQAFAIDMPALPKYKPPSRGRPDPGIKSSLTDEELKECFQYVRRDKTRQRRLIAAAIELKLKEKANG